MVRNFVGFYFSNSRYHKNLLQHGVRCYATIARRNIRCLVMLGKLVPAAANAPATMEELFSMRFVPGLIEALYILCIYIHVITYKM
jgi:hypothetical protein